MPTGRPRRLPLRRLMGALALACAFAGAGPARVTATPSGTAGTADATSSALTWSVRPSPTEAEPDRPNFSFDLDPGATVHDSLRVRNYGTEPLPLAIYASDALTTAAGGLDLLPAGEQPTGVGAWIVLDAAMIEVPAQGFVDVPFTMVVPARAESGDHVGGIVTSFRAPGTDGTGQSVVVDRRLGSRVQVRVAGDLHPQLQVSDLHADYGGTANPVGAGSLRVRYTVTNTGNVRAGAHQTVVVPGAFGFPGREVSLTDMGELLPGNSLTVDIEVPDVWATLRTGVRVELEAVPTRPGDEFDDTSASATASTSTWSVPWAALLLVAVLVLVPAGRRWAGRQRARREADRIQQAVQTAMLVQEAVQAALAARIAGNEGRGAAPDGAVPPPERLALPVAPIGGPADTDAERDVNDNLS